MPKNKVNDPITDQEMAFALLVLSGAMTDRQAAEAVGLNPDSAAYIQSKPCVRDYMLRHRADVEQQLVQQEAEGLPRFTLDREQVLNRLWELAHLSPEMTRNSITGQVNPLPDRGHAKLHPRPSRRLCGEQTRPCLCHGGNLSIRVASQAEGRNHRPAANPCPTCPGLPRSMPWNPARSCTCRPGVRGSPYPPPARR